MIEQIDFVPPRQLVLQGAMRVDAIDTHKPDVRLTIPMYSTFLCRVMRRDFNLTSVKMYYALKQRARRGRIDDLLRLIEDEAQALARVTAPYPFPDSAPLIECTMRILNDEARRLFGAVVVADRAMATILSCPLAEVADTNFLPFSRAHGALKRYVFGYPGSAAGRN